MTFTHKDGYAITTHDDFIAAGFRQGLESPNFTMKNNFWTKVRRNNWDKLKPENGQVPSTDSGVGWRCFLAEARRQTRARSTEELGLVGGKAPSTPGTTDTLKNLAEAEDSLSEVESSSFQRLAGKMLYPQLGRPDDSVRHGHVDIGHVQATGRSNGKADDRQAISWRIKLDKPQSGCGPRLR